MTLNISGREDFVNPPADAIGLAVSALVHHPDEFFVLSDGDLSYVQGQWGDGGFHVEHQRGDLDSHFACPVPLDAGQVTGILQRFLAGESSWMQEYPWDHMPFGALPDTASHMHPFGNFAGTALRHVLRAFEDQAVEFEAEPHGDGLSIWVTHECSARAQEILDGLFPQ